MSNKLNEKELKTVIEVIQKEHDEELSKDLSVFNVDKSIDLSNSIWKLQHQLKHLEDKK